MPDFNREDLQCVVATNAPPLLAKLDSAKLNVLAMNEKMHMVPIVILLQICRVAVHLPLPSPVLDQKCDNIC